mgnify:CR=1 FL=1
MRSTLFWIVMTGIALALAVLLMRHDQGSIAGMSTDDFASLSIKIVWLVALGGAALVIFRENIARALRIPFVSGLPFGHCKDNHAWPVGARATIDGGAGTLELVESGVSVVGSR